MESVFCRRSRDQGLVESELMVNARTTQLLVLVMMLWSTPLWAPTANIYWPAIEVEARLDADGRLHVSERWTVVFHGKWNGGERFFDLRLGQTVELEGLHRIDPLNGQAVTLFAGSIDGVDQYNWTDRHRLRWRSRLATDPPFDNETFHYVLDYTLSGILREIDGSYRLDHEFLFTERVGRIDRFTLDLELDPSWRAQPALPERIEKVELLPSDRVRLTADLTYLPNGRPASVPTHTPIGFRVAAFAAALALMAWLVVGFRRHEAARGRFDAVEVPDPLDHRLARRWLEEKLLRLRPEEVGALWDRKVGPPEVAATVARLVSEGKLASHVDQRSGRRKLRILTLELLVDRAEFDGYERLLIDKLFFEGRTRTDTEAVRKHYQVKGFDPAALIRPLLEARLEGLRGPKPKAPRPVLTWLLWSVVLVALCLEGVMWGERVLVVMAILFLVGVLPIVVGSCFVVPYQRWTRSLGRATLGFLAPALTLAAVSWGAALQIREVPDLMPGVFGVTALAALPVALLSLWLHWARTVESRRGVRLQHEFAAIRRLLVDELKRPQPDLEDAWFPYLLALGLDRAVDKWFASHGAATSGFDSVGLNGSASASPRWTGGGGTFGGAGASASWGAAAASLASGVASPNASGTGSSSRSFSGGGGGGGW